MADRSEALATVRAKLHGGSQLTADDIVLLESEHGKEVASYHAALEAKWEEIVSLRERITTTEKGLRAIEPWKLREIAEWFDMIDELLDRLVVNGQDFRQRYSFPKKDEIQRDLRHWADALEEVEAIVAGSAE